MTIPTVTVSGTYEDAEGNPATGTVTFKLNTPLQDSTDPEVTVSRTPVVATLVNGSFTQELAATSGGDILPTSGVLYSVTEQITGARTRRRKVAFPSSDATVDMADVLPVDDTGVVWAAPLAFRTDAGVLADRPAASADNTTSLYFATDVNGGTLYRSNGASWVQAAASVDTTATGDFVPQSGGRYETLVVEDDSSAAYEIDLFYGNAFDLTLTANCTLTFTGYAGGTGTKGSFDLLLRQDATGSRTVTWPNDIRWAGGSAPTLSTTGSDLIRFVSFDQGASWIGEPLVLAAPIDAVAEFDDPSDLAGLVWWPRAESLALADGAAVSTFTDASGSANPLIQNTTARKPTYVASGLNGLPVVRFGAATADFMDTATAPLNPYATSFTLFVAFKHTVGSLDRDIVQQLTSGGRKWLRYESSTGLIEHNLGGTTSSDPTAYTTATLVRYALRWNKTLSLVELWKNGAVVASRTASAESSTAAMRVGADGSGNGDGTLDIPEIALYSRALTDAEMAQMFTYLNRYA